MQAQSSPVIRLHLFLPVIRLTCSLVIRSYDQTGDLCEDEKVIQSLMLKKSLTKKIF
jgi:hypothetical protein